MKPKVIHLEKAFPAEHLLGTFLNDSHYDILIEEDCDVYKPITSLDKKHGEHNLLLKFRKNVFSPELQKIAYEGLRDAAVESQNRGIAAGPRTEKSIGRDWVTSVEQKVLDALSGSLVTVTSDDPVEEIFSKSKELEDQVSPRGSVWLTLKRPKDFNFKEWAMRVKDLPKNERLHEVEKVNDWISDTSYANPVNSGIAGYFDRYPRIPYCRTTSYSSNHNTKFASAVPFIETISEKFHELVPGRWAAQNAEVSKLDSSFRIGNSAYTTITVNKTYRTAAHRDAGDLPTGFGNLSVVSNGVPYTGAYLVFPEFRAAVNVQPGDMIMMDVHEIHGNTEIGGKGERISIVCYMREKMSECKTKAYEDARFNFIESRRLNTSHPMWYERWNGVSAGMWESYEWSKYLMDSGLHEYATLVQSKTPSLDI